MKLAAILMLASVTAYAQVQSDDIAFARRSDGAIFALSSQPCPVAGFMYWHIDDPKGRTMHTGCWTYATHRRVMVMDKGEAVYFPLKRFSANPNYGE